MNFIERYPILRILISFILGVMSVSNGVFTFSIFSNLLLLLSLFFVLLIFRNHSSKKITIGIIVLLLYFLFGSIFTLLHDHRLNKFHITHLNQNREFDVLAETDYQTKAKSNLLKIVSFYENGKLISASGNFLLKLKNSSTQKIKANSIYLIRGKLKKNEVKELTPGEFDYTTWLARKNVFHTLTAENENLFFIKKKPIVWFQVVFDKIYKLLDALLSNSKIQADVKVISCALLIGNDDGLSEKLLKAYSSTGTLHVLAVSGMHVGLLFSVFQFVFSFFSKSFYTKFLKFIAVLVFIWLYSLLTGFSPSIVRAAIMLSIFLIGETINKKGMGFNTLLITIFIILCFDPLMIFDLGFQLSVSAVSGILIFNSYLRSLFKVKNKLLGFMADLISVSLSAQVFTLPLCIYYFHQVPLLFLPANLLVVPISTLCLFSCLIWVFVSQNLILCSFFGALSSGLIKMMNAIVLWFDSLSFNCISNLRFDGMDLLLSYGLLFFFYCGVRWKSKAFIGVFLLVFILNQLSGFINDYLEHRHYNVSIIRNFRDPILVINKGVNSVTLIRDSTTKLNNKLKNFVSVKGFSNHLILLNKNRNYQVKIGNNVMVSFINSNSRWDGGSQNSDLVLLTTWHSAFIRLKVENSARKLKAFEEIKF